MTFTDSIIHLIAFAWVVRYVPPFMLDVARSAYWTFWELAPERKLAIKRGWEPTVKGTVKTYLRRFWSHMTESFQYDDRTCGNVWHHGWWPWEERWRNFDAD